MKYKLIGSNDRNNIIKQVLSNRGVQDQDGYLHLSESCCDDYNNLDNINKAVKCFVEHFEVGDEVCILCDTDVDGYTSAAMMYMYIKNLNSNYPVSYILHNSNKSHGLSKMDSGDFELPENTKLFIIPDAGSNDIIELNELIDNGVSCIVLDHHQIEPSDIECKAIVVNNQASPNYNNKDFSGAGITFEFLRALDEHYWTVYAEHYLDIVALAQVSDVMDLRSFPTRYYVNQGFCNIKNKMLEALIKAQDFSMKGKINPTTIAWNISPILNAIIRIGSHEERELLFRAFIEDYEEFDYKKRTGETVKENIYERAVRLCKNAKSRQDKMRDKLYASLEKAVNYDDKVSIIVANDGDAGIIGLSAMKLADSIKRPVVVLRYIGNGILGGSLRNYDNSPIEDLKELLNNTGLFKCVGHSSAAGSEIKQADLQKAKDMLNEQLKDIIYDSSYLCDFVLDYNDLDITFVKDIDSYDWVWCTGIKQPIIAVTDINVARKDIYVQGKNHDSVAFEYCGVKYVAFKLEDNNELLKFACDWGDENDIITFDAVVTCSVNSHDGVLRPQCIIKDFNITQQNN